MPLHTRRRRTGLWLRADVRELTCVGHGANRLELPKTEGLPGISAKIAMKFPISELGHT